MSAANDNKPKYVRGTFADMIPAVWEFRNRPDSPPDPLQSSWTTDPSQVVIEKVVEDDGEPAVKFEEDLLLEITPSIRQIVREVERGEITLGRMAPAIKDRPTPNHRQVVGIGKLKFSDGENHERAHKRGLDGDVVAYMRKMPAGAMLGATEKTGAAHGSSTPSAVTISNTNLTHRLQPATGEKIAQRGYTPAIRKRRTGKSFTAEESRILIDEAIANTPVLPPVTICPPGVASGTARYSDQFIGMKIGSTGKGGAPNWVDFFMAGRDHEEWMETISEVEAKHAAVLNSVLSARSLRDVGVAAGQSAKYAAYNGGGWRALRAANDNLTSAIKKKSA